MVFMEVTIRTAKFSDLEDIYSVETSCFPKQFQISYDYYKRALEVYPEHFFLLFVDHKLAGLINAMPTNKKDLSDSMLECMADYVKDGKFLMVIGLMVRPEFQHQGYAARLMKRLIRVARDEGRKSIVLTCRKELIDFYKSFGYTYQGISASVLGDEVWHQLRLDLDDDDDYQ